MYNKNSDRKPGRPRLEAHKAKGEMVVLRLTEAEKTRYEAQAKKSGLKLSAWIRRTLAANG